MINGRLSPLWNGFGKRSGVTNSKMVYTCPMHPEVVQEGPGSCPICGMDLVPMEPTESEENKVYNDLVRKMKIAVVLRFRCS
jgi:Cu2+-exporting ATPase